MNTLENSSPSLHPCSFMDTQILVPDCVVSEQSELYRGDSLEILKSFCNKTVDLVVTDPPYGMDYKSNRRTSRPKFDKFENDKDLDWLEDFFYETHRVLKDNSGIYCFCSWHHVDKFKVAFEQFFTLKNILVWVKNNHGSGDLQGSYAPKHEFILFGHKGRHLVNKDTKRIPDVLTFDKIPSSKLLHPTEKPTPLLETLIVKSSKQGDLVLDPFMGSGSTGLAAKTHGRFFAGIEISEEHFNTAKERLT